MRNISLALLFLFFVSSSCKNPNSLGPSPVPYKSVNIQIETSVPEYTNLNNPGGYDTIAGGNKGIIVLQDYNNNYWAFDRTCPYHVTSPCSIIRMSQSGLNMVCGSYSGKTLDACCASTYGLDGSVTHGPSKYPLKAYQVTVSGTSPNISLYITN